MGMVFFKASAVHAETAICTALNPWLHEIEPEVPVRLGGSPRLNLVSTNKASCLSNKSAMLAMMFFKRIHRKADVAAVEMPAVVYRLGLGINEGIIVGAVHLGLDKITQGVAHIVKQTDHVGSAANRIHILYSCRTGKRALIFLR